MQRVGKVQRLFTTLVSTASTPSFYFRLDCRVHLSEGLRLAGIAKTSDDILDPARRERFCRTEQNSVCSVLDDEFHTGPPSISVANRFRESQLSFRGESYRFHTSSLCKVQEDLRYSRSERRGMGLSMRGQQQK